MGDPEPSTAPPRPGARVIASRLAWVVAWVVLDLWSKAWVFARLGAAPVGGDAPGALRIDRHGHPREELIGDWLALMTTLNPGMAWGFDRLPSHVLVFGRCAAVLVLLWLVVRHPLGRPWMGAALVLVLAGAMGNLHDNLFTEAEGRPFGMVRDFIDVYFPIWDWHFPTFNVADSCISVGAVLLFVTSFRPTPRPAA